MRGAPCEAAAELEVSIEEGLCGPAIAVNAGVPERELPHQRNWATLEYLT